MTIASSSNDHVFFEFSAAQPDSSDVLSEIALNARPSQHALVGCACGQNLVCIPLLLPITFDSSIQFVLVLCNLICMCGVAFSNITLFIADSS